jgi:hypothetical protein
MCRPAARTQSGDDDRWVQGVPRQLPRAWHQSRFTKKAFGVPDPKNEPDPPSRCDPAADLAGTVERLKALRSELFDPQIAEHRGRLVKTTGDGVPVEFASVVDALCWAVAVQQAIPARDIDVGGDSRIELRIGINLGDVIVESDDLYGEGVNIAARAEALAGAGGVFVPIRSTSACATGCPLFSRIWASSKSKTSLGQCGSTASQSPKNPLRKRRFHCRTSRGWQCCRSRT